MKKQKTLIIVIILILLITYIAQNTMKPDPIDVIMLDPGHGATDPGCIYDNIYEKDVNLDIATRLAALLEASGFKILCTHDGSSYTDPHQRAQLANSKGVDLYISIHQNASDSTTVNGIETWYSSKNRHSKQLANSVQRQLIDMTGAKDRGARLTNNLIVVRETSMPSILIECGFLSNPDEREKLKDENYRQLIAQSISQAVDDFAHK